MKFIYLLASLAAMVLATPSPQSPRTLALEKGTSVRLFSGAPLGDCCEGLECTKLIHCRRVGEYYAICL
jgi:hypothetical protein